MMYDDVWWCMMMYDDVWWCMMMYDDVWWCMMMYDDVWWCMMMYVLRLTTTINQSVDLYFQQAGHARNPKFQLRDSRFSNTVFGRSTGICPDSTVDTFHFEKTFWGLCSFQNTFGITLTPGATMCYIDMIEVAIPTPQHWHLWYITGWWFQSP